MKVRNGFVSNSSSSSFVIVTTIENHEKIMEALHPYERACLEALGISKEKFMGKDVVSIGTLSVQDCSPFEYLYVEYDGDDIGDDEKEDMKYESFYHYRKLAKEVCGEDGYVTVSLDG